MEISHAFMEPLILAVDDCIGSYRLDSEPLALGHHRVGHQQIDQPGCNCLDR